MLHTELTLLAQWQATSARKQEMRHSSMHVDAIELRPGAMAYPLHMEEDVMMRLSDWLSCEARL